MLKDIIISNPDRLHKLMTAMIAGGSEHLQILADFDRTLTCFSVNGEKAPSLIAVLRDKEYLNEDYRIQAQALADKYHPLEIDPLLSLSDKKLAMREWWHKHFQLLIEAKLNKSDITKAMQDSGVSLREGVSKFITTLKTKDIPLIIMSATGLGGEAIEFFLRDIGQLHDNIHIISNSLLWDDQGRAVGIKEPIIHSFNKDETLLQDYPAFDKIKERKNIMLLGDTLGDADMARGFDYDNILKIGFLNGDMQENLDNFTQVYDVIILNDASFEYINYLLKEIIS